MVYIFGAQTNFEIRLEIRFFGEGGGEDWGSIYCISRLIHIST